MNTIRNALFGIIGLAVAATVTVVFATIGLAVLGGVALAAIAGAIAVRFMRPGMKPAPGVRRDAQGIVIDM